jgi:hypothetical protein
MSARFPCGALDVHHQLSAATPELSTALNSSCNITRTLLQARQQLFTAMLLLLLLSEWCLVCWAAHMLAPTLHPPPDPQLVSLSRRGSLLTWPGCFAAASIALLVCLSHLRSTSAGGSACRLAMLLLPIPRYDILTAAAWSGSRFLQPHRHTHEQTACQPLL